MVNTAKFRAAVIENGLTYTSLARKIGISKNTLTNKANNVAVFNVQEVMNICKALRIEDPSTVCDIFLRSPPQ